MPLDTKIQGLDGTFADVNESNELKVSLSNVPALVGSVRSFSENDSGSRTGIPYLASPETSRDFRLRAGLDSIVDFEDFNYTAQNTSKYQFNAPSMTLGLASGYLTLNANSVLTSGNNCFVRTYRTFAIYGAAPTYCEQAVAFSAAVPSNVEIDFGLSIPAATGNLRPLDGVYFRANSSGVFGVLNNNGTEVTTAPFSFSPVVGQFYRYNISLNESAVEFWVDDVLVGTITKPANTGAAVYVAALHWFARQHNTGTAGAVVQTRISNYTISSGDYANNRLWSTVMAGQGMSGIQGISGATQGQTAAYANSTAPVSVTLSNTAAGYATLGGAWQFNAVAGAETDYALFGYQVPSAAATGTTGRNLVIRGIWVDSFVMGAAIATTPTLLQWTLGVGATAVSLATPEGSTTKAPRRITLGTQSLPVGAAVGTDAKRIDVNLDAPLYVEAGSWVHVILKMPVSTATATQIIRGVVGINAYWE